MGILTYYDRFIRPKFRLFVAQRIDRFHANIFNAIQKGRTTTEKASTVIIANVTDLLGVPLDTLSDRSNEKIKKIIILTFFIVATGLFVLTFLYCMWWLFRCRCTKKSSYFELREKYFKLYGETDSLEDEICKRPVVAMPVTDAKKLKWFNPKATINDIVVPFFVLIIGK